ncbi:hypothetical protein KDK95_23240 [Actinospica sp. MGRD01-02]|uniref:Uncharacterized protein n=1 Tax=Actinospica acidithermotolerans TaxID=2828514 RepID=A0A941IKS5_9ACTN|nr:hypothetical protein [Actinospica acidithermotolerans]MBR7829242.1 hypothetical protein [Actinospica acidithermotolerans]
MDKSQASRSRIAAVMRKALDQAAWSPDGDPEAAIATLLTLCNTIGSMVTNEADPGDLTVAKVMFESEVLAAVYLFTGEVRKSVDQQHPARPPRYADMPRGEFVESVVTALPYFHRRQRAVSAALNEAFPCEDEGAAGLA